MAAASTRRRKPKALRGKPPVRKSGHSSRSPVLAPADVELTYIVSAFNRPVMLPVALWSIAGQSHQDFQCIVADNADHDPTAKLHQLAVDQVNAFPGMRGKFIYVRTHGKTKVSDCYWAAEWVVKNIPMGRWLCFPCDDTYLVPGFAQSLLKQAAKKNADYVFSRNIIAGPDALGEGVGYIKWKQRLHRIAKTCFIVKWSVFDQVGGFQGKMDRIGTVNADYFFSSQMVEAGKQIASVKGVLLVHN